MDVQIARRLADKIQQSMDILDEVTSLVREEVPIEEQGPILRAIGEIFAIRTDRISAFLAKQNPELTERLLPWLDPEE